MANPISPTPLHTKHTKNHDITAERVKLFGVDGQFLGIFPTENALFIATQQGLDLVMLDYTELPSCRIIDYGHFCYTHQQEQKRRDRHKKHKIFRFRRRTQEEHIHCSTRKIIRWLEAGHTVIIELISPPHTRHYAKAQFDTITNRFATELGYLGVLTFPETQIKHGWRAFLTPHTQLPPEHPPLEDTSALTALQDTYEDILF
ncbi:MAG TPA: hypothetical protein DCE42_30760 [Myxococcales bacterium]|nr:hypothetical protein [Deltaproteobacteria bacterium]MBU49733.1 hypothetical protein [Deltaproteobacteria bacterium]HAA59170.1 hypothetical protein [Myxococcales bacterium]|tara:strand:- start:1474 stop:2082 length:609 start_codon:yes stop_codon:yes gene_type:complete